MQEHGGRKQQDIARPDVPTVDWTHLVRHSLVAPWRISLVLKEHRPPMLWPENMRFQTGLWRLFQAMKISQIPVSFCITKVCPARLLDGSCSWTALFGRVSKDKGYQRSYLRACRWSCDPLSCQGFNPPHAWCARCCCTTRINGWTRKR